MNSPTMIMMVAATVATLSTQAVGFSDPFDSMDPAWVTDRYDPAGFNSLPFDGDNRLRIDISTADSAANRPPSFSSAFYNTQGKQRQAPLSESWTLSGQVYVDEDFTSGNNLRRTDLWGRTGEVGTEAGAEYLILGVARFDPTDAFNPNAENISSFWRVWDGDLGAWVTLDTPVTVGWHDLAITGTATSYTYMLDGVPVYTDATTSMPLQFTTAFVQAYNFGDEDYSVHWDNINLGPSAVPEAGSGLALLALGTMALATLKLRRN